MPVNAKMILNDDGQNVLRITPPPARQPVYQGKKLFTKGTPAVMPAAPVDVVIEDELHVQMLTQTLRFGNRCFGGLGLKGVTEDEALAARQRLNDMLAAMTVTGVGASRADLGVRLLMDTIKGDYSLTLRFDPAVWGDMSDNLKIREEERFVAVTPRKVVEQPVLPVIKDQAAQPAPVKARAAPRQAAAGDISQPLPFTQDAQPASPPPVVAEPPVLIEPPRDVVVAPLPDISDGTNIVTVALRETPNTINMPNLKLTRNIRSGEAVLRIAPKPRHGKHDEVDVAVPSGMLGELVRKLVETPDAIVDANRTPTLGVPPAVLQQQLDQMNAGLAPAGMAIIQCSAGITHSGNARPRLKFVYNQNKWGRQPGDFAMRGSEPPLPIGLPLAGSSGSATARPKPFQKMRRIAPPVTENHISRRRKAQPKAPPPLLEIMIDERGDTPKVMIDSVAVDATAREIKLLKATSTIRCSPIVFLDNIGEQVDHTHDGGAKRREHIARVKVELTNLNDKLVRAAKRGPRATELRQKVPANILSHGGLICLQKARMRVYAPGGGAA